MLNSHKPSSVRVEVASGQNSLAIDGDIERKNSTAIIDVGFKLEFDELSEVKRVMERPFGAIDSIRASGHFQSAGLSSFRFSNLSIKSGKNSIGGQIAFEMPEGGTILHADLNSEYLDLRDFVSENEI